jgi:hypothetical protein
MSYGSESHLSTELGSSAAMCLMALYGPRTSSIKKSLAGLPVQLGMHIPNARTYVSNAPDIRVIMGLQDVRADNTVNACKACIQAATVRLQYSASTIDHSPSTAIVPSDSTAWRHTAD